MTPDVRLALYSFLEALGQKVDLSTFEKRVFVQKIVYLAQEVGIGLGFRFGWYVHGPYSPTLAENAFKLESLVRSADSCKIDLPKSTLNSDKIEIVKELIEDVNRKQKTIEYWLELLASAHFLCTYAYPKAKDEIEVTKRLEILKRETYGLNDVREAFDLLRKYELVQKK